MFRLTNFIKEILHLISHLHRICARWLVRLIIIITILQKTKEKKKRERVLRSRLLLHIPTLNN